MNRLALVALAACGSSSSSDDPPDPDRPRRLRADAAPPWTPPTPDALGPYVDPDYPTAQRAGTDDLFFVADPLRGPHVTQVAMPDRAKLIFTEHAHCEIDDNTVVCGSAGPDRRDLASVRVGSDRGRPVLVEWRRGKRVDQSVVMTYDVRGDVEQMARLDAAGTIDWVRTYAPAGRRYTARHLDGRNALPGCGGIALSIDAGRVTSATCLQWLGGPMKDTNGVVTAAYERDAAGFKIVETRLGHGGRLVNGMRDLVHEVAITRDAKGRRTAEVYTAVAGHPAGNAAERGCFAIDLEHTKNQETKRTCKSATGEAMSDEDGVTIAITTRDKAGCATGTIYRTGDGEAATRDGVHQYEEEVDDRCFKTKMTCLGVDGAKTPCGPEEPAVYRYTRDDRGRVTSTTYEDIYGNPTIDHAYEVQEVRNVWDDLGRKIEQACFDHGSAAECGRTGFHRMVDTYDANGREIEERFYDAYGNEATNMGAVYRRYVYDNYDHLYEAQDFDAAGNLMLVHGMAVKRNYYDDSHRLFGIVMLDDQHRPSMYESCYTGVYCPNDGNSPWHAVALIRSPTGKVIQNKYFDTSGQVIEEVDCRDAQCWDD